MGNFGVRSFDDEDGRFTSIDPLWEEFPSITPFNYAENNPVLLNDPNGDCPWCIVVAALILFSPNVAVAPTRNTEGDAAAVQASKDASKRNATTILSAGGSAVAIAKGLVVNAATDGSGDGAASTAASTTAMKQGALPSTRVVQAQEELAKAAKGTTGSGAVVSPKGTALPNSQSETKAGFDKAGFPSKPATGGVSGEKGTIYTVPTKDGKKIDVRLMEGGKAHNQRAVITHEGTNSGKNLDGKATNVKKENHFPQTK